MITFGLLSAAFFIRFLGYGYKWLTHAMEAGTNFKAKMVWALIYVVVCGAIAAVARRLPRAAGEAVPPQNGERGT